MGRILYGDRTHMLSFTKLSISQILKAANFVVTDACEDIPGGSRIKSCLRFLAWKFVHFIYDLIIYIETQYRDKKTIYSQNVFVIAKKE